VLSARGQRGVALVGEHDLDRHAGVERVAEQMVAVEERDIRIVSPRGLPEAANDLMLAARDARRGGHGHRDSMLASDPTMKAALIKRFEQEISLLEKELTQELPREIQRARELGDLRENAEYHAAKERQRFVEARVSMLKKRVSEIQLMNMDRIPHDRAGFGSKLTIRENGRTATFELVMPEDSDPDKGLISVASPIGRALVGKEEGDEVAAPTPAGLRTFEILRLVTIHDEEA